MRLQKPGRPRERPADEGRREGEPVRTAGGARVLGGFAVPRRGAAHLTGREIMAAARERLAARGFDWGDALRAGSRSSLDGHDEEGQ